MDLLLSFLFLLLLLLTSLLEELGEGDGEESPQAGDDTLCSWAHRSSLQAQSRFSLATTFGDLAAVKLTSGYL
jgi:hypothetical protein